MVSPDRTNTINEMYATTRIEDKTRLRKFGGIKGTHKSIDTSKHKFNISSGAFTNHHSLVASVNNTPHARNPSV